MTAVRSREEGVGTVAAVQWPKGARARTAVRPPKARVLLHAPLTREGNRIMTTAQSPPEATRATTPPRPPEASHGTTSPRLPEEGTRATAPAQPSPEATRTTTAPRLPERRAEG
ncbi:hypothetical protein ACFW93_12680 [Streptomyces canus]|uniref:hypothetical protein n=1 Tax=Streptomyces canus TaxID=58343 RepID=UPI0036CA5EC9